LSWPETTMPLYEYQCQQCKHRMEVIQGLSEASPTNCPECNGELKRLFSAPAIQFKGSGFYKTDYASSSSSPSSGSTSSDASSTKSESKSDSKSEAKPETKSESKSESKSETKSESRPSSSAE
jgi:putative FmdB family regulatory protein